MKTLGITRSPFSPCLLPHDPRHHRSVPIAGKGKRKDSIIIRLSIIRSPELSIASTISLPLPSSDILTQVSDISSLDDNSKILFFSNLFNIMTGVFVVKVSLCYSHPPLPSSLHLVERIQREWSLRQREFHENNEV
jgi:hypothetical protein